MRQVRLNFTSNLLEVVLVAIALFGLLVQQAAAQSDQAPQQRSRGRYAFRMTPVKSFSTDAPGDPGGLAAAPRQDILRVGFFTADGNGNLTGRTIATTDTNNGATWIVSFNWTGEYVLNSDGTGFFSIEPILESMVCTDTTVSHSGPTPHPVAQGGTPFSGNVACPADIEGHEDYAFVFSRRGGKRIEFIQTDNDGGGAKIFLTGVATARESFGKGDEEKEDGEN